MLEKGQNGDQIYLFAPDDNRTCDNCGRFGALTIGDHSLCPDCLDQCGSCCPEFGKENETAQATTLP